MKKLENLKLRSDVFRSIRNYFYEHGFIEVETPVKIHAPAPEEFIESVRSEGDFLRTSPELAMKILLADGMEKIFQIGACFRANEYGRRHREEFTMLEFYQRGMEYREMALFTAGYIAHAAREVLGKTRIPYGNNLIDLEKIEFLTVKDAFLRYAGISSSQAQGEGNFDELMVTKIEPNLGRDGITFLCDYPAECASLARLKADDPTVAERFEVYIAGLELANAFGELTDPAEQRSRFKSALEYRASQGMHPYPEAVEFFAALERGLPQSSGCAMGLDRLIMIFCNTGDIADVRV